MGLRKSWLVNSSGRIMAATAAGLGLAMLITSFYNPGNYSMGFRKLDNIQNKKELEVVEKSAYEKLDFSMPTSITGKDGVFMNLIPGGDFMMGSRDGNYDERPVRKIVVNQFYMDKFEVTNSQYAKFLNEYGKDINKASNKLIDIDSLYCLIEKSNNVYKPKDGYENHPVVTISWYGAAAYAQFYGKRLPTEAEWEKAARGRLMLQNYPWGNNPIQDYANTSGMEGKDKWIRTSPIDSFMPNSYGLYDMIGNVWEFCADEYDARYYATSSRINPQGPGIAIEFLKNDFLRVRNHSRRVARGGSWNDDLSLLRVSRRSWFNPGTMFMMLGFRCAQD